MKEKFQRTAINLLVFMWVYAAVSKWVVVKHFRIQLSQMPWIAGAGDVLVWLVPTVEIIIALLLICEPLRKKGALLSMLLLIVFTGYIATVVRYAPQVPCSCGGIISTLSWNAHIVFNIFFLLLSFSIMIKDLPFDRRKQGKLKTC
jgi:hypothetical protein